MGWNCMECGALLIPKEEMTVDSKAGNLSVGRNICSECGAEFITVFRWHGSKNNYLGLVKIWPDD